MPKGTRSTRNSAKRARLVPAVDRAVRVLRALAADDGDPRLSDLSRRLRLSKSTLSGLLATLEHHGFVEREDGTRAYRLGAAVLELGHAVLQRQDIREIARPHLVRLRDLLGETAVLHVPAGDEAIIVERAESNHDLKVVAPPGHRLPPFAGAVAKVFLASLPDDQLIAVLKARALPAFTPHSITTLDRYMEDLRRVRRRGYATDDEEYLPGVRAVSAPVRNARGRTPATVTVVGSAARLTRERVPEAVAAVTAAAEAISRSLGAPPHASARTPGLDTPARAAAGGA